MPLFRAVKLAERYDIAIMSTKGMSVTASRELVDKLCANHDIPLLVLHDFDKSGFSIVGTLRRDTRRYAFEHKIEVIDLGMRLEDVAGLQREASNISSDVAAARMNLEENGATEEEIAFLLKERVELNAFTSDALVARIENKLERNYVKKVVPNEEMLAAAYRRAGEHVAVQEMIDEAVKALRETLKAAEVPGNLRALVEERLTADPRRTWDSIVMEIAVRAKEK